MPHVQPEVSEDIEREIRLYYFTVDEVASILRCSDRSILRYFQGKMIWYDGRWMISPTDVRNMRESK